MATSNKTVDAAVKRTIQWQDELTAAEQEAEAAANATPATPASAAKVAERRWQARERVEVARDALAAAKTAEDAARRAAVDAEADAMGTAIETARAALNTHDQRTAELLAALTEYTGSPWAPITRLINYTQGSSSTQPIITEHDSRHIQLARELADLQAIRDALLAAAAGDEPNLPVDQLPAALQVGGILPAASAIAAAQAEAERAAFEAERAAEQATVDAAIKVCGVSGEAATQEVMLEYERPSEYGLRQFDESLKREWTDDGHTLAGITEAQREALLTIARLAGTTGAWEVYLQLHPAAALTKATRH